MVRSMSSNACCFPPASEMAHYRAELVTSLGQEEVFAYLSDFSTTKEWDPGVVNAERIGGAPPQQGSEFRLQAEFLGRKTEITYRIVEFDPPNTVTLFGENATVVSSDRITCEETADGTRVIYDADLQLRGVFRIADPLLDIVFRRMGDRALTGLKRRFVKTERLRAAGPATGSPAGP